MQLTKLRLAPRHFKGDRVIEIWQGGEMIGAIYPTGDGVRIMSKYLTEDIRLDRMISLDRPALAGGIAIHIREPKRGDR